jgi:accessory gene regulator protein AgrB
MGVTIIWIFHNVLPWVGLYLVLMTAIFFMLLLIYVIRQRRYIHSGDYVVEAAADSSTIVNIVPMLMIVFISWLIKKIMAK